MRRSRATPNSAMSPARSLPDRASPCSTRHARSSGISCARTRPSAPPYRPPMRRRSSPSDRSNPVARSRRGYSSAFLGDAFFLGGLLLGRFLLRGLLLGGLLLRDLLGGFLLGRLLLRGLLLGRLFLGGGIRLRLLARLRLRLRRGFGLRLRLGLGLDGVLTVSVAVAAAATSATTASAARTAAALAFAARRVRGRGILRRRGRDLGLALLAATAAAAARALLRLLGPKAEHGARAPHGLDRLLVDRLVEEHRGARGALLRFLLRRGAREADLFALQHRRDLVRATVRRARLAQHLVARHRAELALAVVLQQRLVVALGAVIDDLVHDDAQVPQHELARRGETGVEVDGADDRLEHVADERARDRLLLDALADEDEPLEPHRQRDALERGARNRLGLDAGQSALVRVGEAPVQLLGDQGPEHAVAQELHALVARTLVRLGAGVGERVENQALVPKDMAQQDLEVRDVSFFHVPFSGTRPEAGPERTPGRPHGGCLM